MSRIHLTGIVLFLFSNCFCSEVLQEKIAVHFAKDIDTLSISEKEKLIDFFLNSKPFFIKDIAIYGHTDGDGSTEYNKDLAKRRTKAIQSILNNTSIKADILIANSFGEKKHVVKEHNEASKSKNRRVEITINYLKANTIDEILSTIQTDFTQLFSFDSKIKNIDIKGKKGSEIKINRDDLVFENGNPLTENDKIVVKLNEIQSFLDQIQANISTESIDGKILESGGMINISVEANGQKLKLRDSATYSATLPNKFKTTGMNVFQGVKDSSGVMKWENTAQNFPLKTRANPIRPSVCLDPKKLDSWYIQPRLSEYLVQREFIFIKPKLGTSPTRLPNPKKPVFTNQKSYFTWWQKIVIAKSKRDKVIEEINQKRLDRFLTKTDKYDIVSTAYNQKIGAYKLKEKAFHDSLSAYKDSILYLYKYLNNYRVASLEGEYIKNLKRRIKTMVKLSEKDSLFIYDLYKQVKFKPDHYYKEINFQFEEYVMEYYNIDDRKKAMHKFYNSRDEGDYDPQNLAYKTVGEWKKTSNDPVVAYLKSKNMELYEREQLAGYKSELDNFDFFQASLSDFAWINCDRYIKSNPDIMASYKIKTSMANLEVPLSRTIVTMPSINSCLQVFNQFTIPKNQMGTVLSYYLNADKKIMLAKTAIDRRNGLEIELEYKPVTLKEFTNELGSL
jgi:hypothetical protein